MADLQLVVDGTELSATWTGENAETRGAIAATLPLEGSGTRWGRELYAPIPVEASPESTREVVDVGAVAYWPDGPALCLFWGETLASRGDEPRAATPVGVVAKLADVEPLAETETGSTVRLERA